MTKLNITNKRIYKLKKHKNQSKKKMPKKRKNKRRRGRKGRSFRKRRKYNIKNNSIRKYSKQKGGAPGVNIGRQQLGKGWKSAMIVPWKNENDIVQFKLLDGVPYVTNSGDTTYAKALPATDAKGDTFDNYFLNEPIQEGEKKGTILEMITARINRYIYEIIMRMSDKTDIIKQGLLKAIGGNMQLNFFSHQPSQLRNRFEEKVATLSFLKWLLNVTEDVKGVDTKNDLNNKIKGESLANLFYLYLSTDDSKGRLLRNKGEINKSINFNPSPQDILEKAYHKISTSPPLKKCEEPNDEDGLLERKLNLAMTAITPKFNYEWASMDSADLLDKKKKSDNINVEVGQLADELDNISKKKKEEYTSYIAGMKSDEKKTNITSLEAQVAALKEQVKEKKGIVATENVTSNEANVAATAAKERINAQKLEEMNSKLKAGQTQLDAAQSEISVNQMEIDRLKKAIDECSSDNKDKQNELKQKLTAAENTLAEVNEKVKTLETDVVTLTDKQSATQERLDVSKTAKAQAEKRLGVAKTDKVVIESGGDLKSKDAGDEDDDDMFAFTEGDEEAEGTIHAPMPDNGEVLVYLKRRADGKFIVSTLGTGGDDGDQTNLWIKNIGSGPASSESA